MAQDAVLEMVRAAGVRPAQHESPTRPLLLQGEGVASPDGRWVALISQHVYGTQDVLVLTSTE